MEHTHEEPMAIQFDPTVEQAIFAVIAQMVGDEANVVEIPDTKGMVVVRGNSPEVRHIEAGNRIAVYCSGNDQFIVCHKTPVAK